MHYLSFKSEKKYMRCTWESCLSVRLRTLLVVLSLSVGGAVLFCEPCVADLPSRPLVPQPIAWSEGPTTASLGAYAEIRVARGFSYTSAKGARAFLEGMHKPAPNALVGILQPDSGAWWVTFEFAEVGYVKDADKD